MENVFRVDTPEAVEVSYDIAGIGTRFLACLVDSLIVVAMEIAVVVGAVMVSSFNDLFHSVGTVLGLTLSFVLIFGYFVIYETLWSGQTPGKRSLSIRVMKTSGYPVGFVESFVRNLVRWIDFLPSFYAIGLVTMFVSRESRRLGDYAAGTVVIKERPPATLHDMETISQHAAARSESVSAPGTSDPDELSWNLNELTNDDLQILRAFLDRAPTLDDDARGRLGKLVSERIAPRISARQPYDPVRFLQRVLALLSTR
ncbi:MAG: RDD family protein [Chloroflexota bacterium]